MISTLPADISAGFKSGSYCIYMAFTTALNIATAAAEQGKPVNNSTNMQSEPAKNKRLSKAKKRKSDNENTERYEFINAFDPVIYEKFKLTCIQLNKKNGLNRFFFRTVFFFRPKFWSLR